MSTQQNMHFIKVFNFTRIILEKITGILLWINDGGGEAARERGPDGK